MNLGRSVFTDLMFRRHDSLFFAFDQFFKPGVERRSNWGDVHRFSRTGFQRVLQVVIPITSQEHVAEAQ